MFAADLYEVLMQRGKRPIYEKPGEFFALTFPTYNLRQLVRDVVLCLAGKNDKAVRQLELTTAGERPIRSSPCAISSATQRISPICRRLRSLSSISARSRLNAASRASVSTSWMSKKAWTCEGRTAKSGRLSTPGAYWPISWRVIPA